tara:strand:+ start:5866 stop:6546 length:681 start_codon:yes stop_codon:yes gene_type:complete
MPKHKLNQLSTSETKAYRGSITEWAQPLVTGAVTSVYEALAGDGNTEHWDAMPDAGAILARAVGSVTAADLEDLAGDQGIAFQYPKRLLSQAHHGVRDVVGVRLVMGLASISLDRAGVQAGVDWDETLDAHWNRVQKRVLSKLVSAVMTDAFEKDDEDDSDEDEDDSDEEDEEDEEEGGDEELEEDSEEEEEEEEGEEEEVADEEVDEAREELEEIREEAKAEGEE